MRMIELHDHLNPTQTVEVDADSVSSVVPFGSGSAVAVAGIIVGVHETVAQVMELIGDQK